ncbi:MAG: hypothetical protein ABIZ80_25920, partial [Bryobacteraceae bacterium]
MRFAAGLILCGMAAFSAPPSVVVKEFRVLYDGQKDGYYASAGGAIVDGKRLEMAFFKASDAAAGIQPYWVETKWKNVKDLGSTWTKPRPFGGELLKTLVQSPESEFLGLSLFGPTTAGTTLSIGFHTRKPVHEATYRQDVRWRPGAFVLGRREKGRESFDYKQYATGEFMGEQFAAPGIITSSGRILLTIWGAAKQ